MKTEMSGMSLNLTMSMDLRSQVANGTRNVLILSQPSPVRIPHERFCSSNQSGSCGILLQEHVLHRGWCVLTISNLLKELSNVPSVPWSLEAIATLPLRRLQSQGEACFGWWWSKSCAAGPYARSFLVLLLLLSMQELVLGPGESSWTRCRLPSEVSSTFQWSSSYRLYPCHQERWNLSRGDHTSWGSPRWPMLLHRMVAQRMFSCLACIQWSVVGQHSSFWKCQWAIQVLAIVSWRDILMDTCKHYAILHQHTQLRWHWQLRAGLRPIQMFRVSCEQNTNAHPWHVARPPLTSSHAPCSRRLSRSS